MPHPSSLLKQLSRATSRPVSALVAFCDVRGFSNYSQKIDCADCGRFSIRYFQHLITENFKGASFVKPAGDGLLMVFPYNASDEAQLRERSIYVISTCFKVLESFPAHFANSAELPGRPPTALGFGISMGQIAEIRSGGIVLDYSGHILNTAARLNEYARPSGIILDGRFRRSLIPAEYSREFRDLDVYIRGISESSPVQVHMSSSVRIPLSALQPIRSVDLMKRSMVYSPSTLSRSRYLKFSLDEGVVPGAAVHIECNYLRRGDHDPISRYIVPVSHIALSEKDNVSSVSFDMAAMKAHFELIEYDRGDNVIVNLEFFRFR